MSNKYLSKLALTIVFAGSACGPGGAVEWPFGKKDDGSVTVKQVETRPEISPANGGSQAQFAAADERSAHLQAAPASQAVSGLVTFTKSRLFDREFLYGFDLQYTSGSDSKLSLLPQSQALGHVPCFFRQIGEELQLVADQTRLFESNINHPELLLARYKVVNETDDSLTVSFVSSGLAVNEAVNGKGADLPKQTWLRSLEFVADGDYLLQETALQLKDGSIQTYLESVFPRSNLAPDGYKPLQSVGSEEPLAERYRFLDTESVYVVKSTKNGVPVRAQTTYAERFDISNGKTIDWYVTPNAPDELMPIFKSGVEGWNRYFNPQQGRDVMRFLGRLPAGVKLGDPRYNVINFDSVAEAGAAYESQAVDPMTGLQSHSLIYMPYAWYNIGLGLWKQRVGEPEQTPSEAVARAAIAPKAPETLFGRDRRVLSCVRLADDAVAMAANGDWTEIVAASDAASVPVPASVDEFARRLMIATLFHEVGHALGMAHNFKGSLAFNATTSPSESNPVTWSIMDYNYFQNEQGLFEQIGGTAGPILEYDRQFISQLYNDGKDVKSTDPVIPACDDDEADATQGGVDPLCLRYDSELSPILALQNYYNNVIAEKGARGIETKTLAEAIRALRAPVAGKFAAIVANESDGDSTSVVADAVKLGQKVGDLVSYYISAGAQSLRTNLTNNTKALRVWGDAAKVDDEAEFRRTYADILRSAMAWRSLPNEPAAAIAEIGAAVEEVVSPAATKAKSAAVSRANGHKAKMAFETALNNKIVAALSKLRASVYPGLKYDAKNLFALSLEAGGELSNFEELAVRLLTAGLTVGLERSGDQMGLERDERLAAAQALLSYRGVMPEFDAAVSSLAAEAAKAKLTGDARVLAAVREVQQVLTSKPEPGDSHK
ncbi:MAG: hypothetical protein FJ146_17225 [Deltaproteobacteria bacterium]|nr:hypothetical protein [Deltaproteobacteria bacterium]